MIRVAMIVRSTIFTVRGGDTVQILQTAQGLMKYNIKVDVRKSDEFILYTQYDLLHFFNITRPQDILSHLRRCRLPFVVSTILIDYAEYDRFYRRGLSGLIFRYLKPATIEYFKVIARWLVGNDKLVSWRYILKGQERSIREILTGASLLLPNSRSEYSRLENSYSMNKDYLIVPNGVDGKLFKSNKNAIRNPRMVLCVARIEGIKNQINLIRALNNTGFTLVIIGQYAPNQKSYYQRCRREANANVHFIEELTQKELLSYYQKAKVHVLPSWFETTGLSSLESAFMGCNIVVSDRGDTREYFGDFAQYCLPESPESIYAAIVKASQMPFDERFKTKISNDYTWQKASLQTAEGYYKVMNKVWN